MELVWKEQTAVSSWLEVRGREGPAGEVEAEGAPVCGGFSVLG